MTRLWENGLGCEDGNTHELEEILWVTNAAAPSWPEKAGLAVDAAGFIQVNDSLQSVSHPDVFAAGDVAAVQTHPREKAGVFAVRQGPPLSRNLRRALLGQPPQPYRPQKHWLSLISTGDKYAIASRGRLFLRGRLIWRWKDWIDRRFMDKFNVLPDMEPAAAATFGSRAGGQPKPCAKSPPWPCAAAVAAPRSGRRPSIVPWAACSRWSAMTWWWA